MFLAQDQSGSDELLHHLRLEMDTFYSASPCSVP